MIAVYIIIAVLVLLVIWYFSTYNSLISLRNRKDDQFSQIDVQLKRRADLIPNLVETVKGYAKHESKTLEDVIKARNTYTTAHTIDEKVKASGEITSALNKLFALSESYPDLKADKHYLDLSKQLVKIEEDIANSRKYYNAVVREYNNLVEMFPYNLIAKVAGYKVKNMFEIVLVGYT